MPRDYRYIKEYEEELHKLKLEGLTLKKLVTNLDLAEKNLEMSRKMRKNLWLSPSTYMA